MSATTYLPVDPDYGSSMSDALNRVRTRSAGGQVYERQAAAAQRRWVLTWVRRSKADMQSLRNFLRNRAQTGDFFAYEDKEESRKYSVRALSDLQAEPVGNEQWNIRLEIEEAIGVAMDVYPQTPLGDSLHAAAVDVGTGMLVTYSGYGFSAAWTGGNATIVLDGVSLGSQASPYAKYDVALGLHRVEFQPNTRVLTSVQPVI